MGSWKKGGMELKWLRTPAAHDNQQWGDTFMHNNLNQPAVNEAHTLTAAVSLYWYTAKQSVLVWPVLNTQLYTVHNRIS